MQQGQRLCSAMALTPVTAVELRSVDFQRLMTQKPQACLKLLMAIVSQFGARLRPTGKRSRPCFHAPDLPIHEPRC